MGKAAHQIQPMTKPVRDRNRAAVIAAESNRGDDRHNRLKANDRKWGRVEVIEVLKCARGTCYSRRHRALREVRRHSRNATAWNCRIKRRTRIPPNLRRQTDSTCANVTHFQACILRDLVLNAQAPGKNFWLNDIRVESLSCG